MNQKTERPKRRTFLSYEEILNELVERCRYIDRTLREAIPHVDESHRQTCKRVAETQSELADGLSEYARIGPPAIRSMQFQYLPDDSGLELDAQDPDLLDAVEAANDDMKRLLESLAEKISADSAQAEFLQLAEKVATVNRTISFIRGRESEV